MSAVQQAQAMAVQVTAVVAAAVLTALAAMMGLLIMAADKRLIPLFRQAAPVVVEEMAVMALVAAVVAIMG
jgi:phosphohistidine swiveling domain-containing protein